MNSTEQAARAPHRVAFFVVILGVVAVAAVMLWEHLSQPSGSPAIPHVNEPAAGLSAGLDILYTALGIRRPVESAAAPDFTLLTLEGRPARLREFKGKLVLLNFWATWCAPACMRCPVWNGSIRSSNRRISCCWRYPWIARGRSRQTICGQLETHVPSFAGQYLGVSRQYSVRGLPTTYLIDPDGLLIGVVIGARDWYGTEAKALIAGLLRQIPAPSDHSEQAPKEHPPGALGTP